MANLPNTCRYSAMILEKWVSQWIFANPTLVVGGGMGYDTVRNIQTIQKRQAMIYRNHKVARATDTENQFKHMAEFGTKNIQRTVWRGGTYLGICNGAYIAGVNMKYRDHAGNRFNHGGLGLLLGTTSGPVFPGLDMIPMDVVDAYGQPHPMWYHNGGTFPRTGGNNTDYRIHAVYDTDDSSPAVVSFRYGSGTVILTGIHPEFNREGMNDKSFQLFDGIFKKLGVVSNA